MNKLADGLISINRSKTKLSGLTIGGVLFVWAGVWLANGGAVESKLGEVSIYVGWFGGAFLGLCLVVSIQRLLFGCRTPVVLSPSGFVDKRTLRNEIAWKSVSRMTVWTFKGNSIICLYLTSDARRNLQLNWIGTVTRLFNKWDDTGDVYVASTDLDISFPDLLSHFRQYLMQYQPNALADGQSPKKKLIFP
ncbi:MAG: STM3941 family protein [Pseudomonadota bacterium]